MGAQRRAESYVHERDGPVPDDVAPKLHLVLSSKSKWRPLERSSVGKAIKSLPFVWCDAAEVAQ